MEFSEGKPGEVVVRCVEDAAVAVAVGEAVAAVVGEVAVAVIVCVVV